jgi:hypothetical protein
MRVPGHLPEVAVGVGENAGVTAPGLLGRRCDDPSAGLLGPGDERIDGGGRFDIVGERDAAKAAALRGDPAIRGQRFAPNRASQAPASGRNTISSDGTSLTGQARPSA